MSKEKFVRDKPHVNIGTIALIVLGIISMFSLGMMIFIDIMEKRDSDGDTIPDLAEGNAGHPLFFDTSDNVLFFRTYETSTSNHEVGHNLDISHDGLSSHVNVQLGLHDDVSTAIPVLDFNIKYRRTGETNPAWKGNKVGITALHRWIGIHKPKPTDGKCQICHQVADEKGRTKLVLSNIKNHQYTRNIDDYQYVHSICHERYDAKKRRSKSKENKKSRSKKNISQVGYWLS